MAEVSLGRLSGPARFERLVVLKQLRASLAKDEGLRAMMLDEARLVAGINHPNVVQIFELLVLDRPCIVMEYLEGDTLAALLAARKEPLPPALAAYIVAEACAGAHAAHELKDPDGHPREVVHRDLSPNNVFLTREGAVKVLDFGVARYRDRMIQTEGERVVRGTYAYMSPEQSVGAAIDRRSDIFSLGVVLWECLTGRPLFKRETLLATARALVEETAVPPSMVADDVPPQLDAICARAMSKDSAQRHLTAADMRVELMGLALPGGGREELATLMRALPARDLSAVTTWAESPSGRRRVSKPLLVGALALLLGAVGAWWVRPPPVEGQVTPPVLVEPSVTVEASTPRREPPAPVSVRIETLPTNAAVFIDGRAAGQAPVTVQVPASDTPLHISAQKPGHQPATTEAVPLRPLELTLTLDPVPRRAKPKPSKPTTGADPLRSKW